MDTVPSLPPRMLGWPGEGVECGAAFGDVSA